jgi:ribosome-binding factor A
MESKRQLKYAKLIQKELGDIFQKEARHVIGPGLVTLTRVLMSPDLGLAKVYLSCLFGDTNAKIESINTHKKEIRHALAKRIGKSVRVIPELAFFPDDSASYAQHMDKVISDLEIPPAPLDELEDDE